MSRTQRTKQYRDFVKQGWSRKFWSFIEETHDKPWDWLWISGKEEITLEIIRENLDKPWKLVGISNRTDITTWDIIKENLDIPWKVQILTSQI